MNNSLIEVWPEVLESIKDNCEQLVPLIPDPSLHAELPPFLLSTLSLGYLYLFAGDARNPRWGPMLNPAFNLTSPNPDLRYFFAVVEDSGVYRIAGWRGTVRQVQISVGADFLGLTDRPGPTLQDFELDELNLGPDGRFEVILSKARPADYSGDWRLLNPGAHHLMARQTSYDWLNERDAILTIERLDVAVPAPRLSAEEIARRMRCLKEWPLRMVRPWFHWMANMRNKGLLNKMDISGFSSVGGQSAMRYYEGLYELSDDEALIVESDVPTEYFYWSVLLTDGLFRNVDSTTRQGSLNGHQIHIDDDGRARFVIAPQDPAVPNWLDCGGYRAGCIHWRWNRCSSFPDAPTVRRVKFAELHRHLPASTPKVSAGERDHALRQRWQGAQVRRFW